jgi:hypothetical protein
VASDLVTTNNVATGVYTLTKNYYQNSVREILLELASEEDYFVWLDEDDDIHFIPMTSLVDSGRYYTNSDAHINEYNFEYLQSENYTTVEVHGYGSTETGVHLIYKNPLSTQMAGGERTKVIVDPRVTSNAEALRVAREFFINSEGFLIGTLQIPTDCTLDLGYIITVTIRDDKYSIKNKKFVILEIKELFFEDQMILTLIEYGINIADYLYEQFLQNKKQEQIFLDSAATKTYALQLDIVIGVKHTYLVEVSTNGSTWSIYASGKAVTTNRAIAILTACIGNDSTLTNILDGDFSNGLVFKIGSGRSLPLVTDTNLNNPITGEEQTILPSAITQTTGNGYSIAKATGTWDNTAANDYIITEFGYYADRQDPSTPTTIEYITNGGFELGTGAVADDWDLGLNTERTSTDPYAGTYSIQIDNINASLSQTFDTPTSSNEIDSISIYAKTDSTFGSPCITIYIYYTDGTNSSSTYALTTGYAQYTHTPDADKFIYKIQIVPDSFVNNTFIDNVSLIIDVAETNNKYATISKWSPYNVATQIHARCVIPPFKKTSSNHIRCTFTAYIEISPQLKGGV